MEKKMQYLYSSIKRPVLIFGALLFTVNAQANECAAVKMMQDSAGGQEVVYELVGHNGKFAEKHDAPSKYRAVINGSKEYYLAPGTHTLTFTQLNKKKYRLYKRHISSDFIQQTKPSLTKNDYVTSTVQISVEKNRRYNLSAEKIGNGKEFAFNISSTEEISNDSCSKDNIIYQASSLAEEIILSESLDYKLKHLMTKLQTVKKNNFTPTQVNWSFGAVFDKSNGFNTLAVLPYSFASKLKLASGDEIIEINGTKVTGNPYSVLNGLLVKLKLGSEVNMTINRSGQMIKLSHKYLPIIVPKVDFQIDSMNNLKSLKNSVDLPKAIKYQYDNLMVEIAEYANQYSSTQGNVTIKSRQKYDTSFGLSGKNETVNNKSVFLVYGVSKGSPADKLNLQKKDIITAINGKKLLGTPSAMLSNEFKQLSLNQSYSVSVLRDDVKYSLIGRYEPILFPKFQLTLDLDERNLAHKYLFDSANMQSRIDFERNRLDKFGIKGMGMINRGERRRPTVTISLAHETYDVK
jgi:C-terminal processing protease CtpA/Prc